MPWAIIEHFDEDDGELTTHIVPYVEVENSFKTRAECEAFVEKIEAMGSPTVGDEDDNIIGLHIGHILSPSCSCGPQTKEFDPHCYIHNLVN